MSPDTNYIVSMSSSIEDNNGNFSDCLPQAGLMIIVNGTFQHQVVYLILPFQLTRPLGAPPQPCLTSRSRTPTSRSATNDLQYLIWDWQPRPRARNSSATRSCAMSIATATRRAHTDGVGDDAGRAIRQEVGDRDLRGETVMRHASRSRCSGIRGPRCSPA